MCRVFRLNGHKYCGIPGDELMVGVAGGACEEVLALPHAGEMDFTGRPMRGLVSFAAAGLGDDRQPEQWVDRGLRFVSELPAK